MKILEVLSNYGKYSSVYACMVVCFPDDPLPTPSPPQPAQGGQTERRFKDTFGEYSATLAGYIYKVYTCIVFILIDSSIIHVALSPACP